MVHSLFRLTTVKMKTFCLLFISLQLFGGVLCLDEPTNEDLIYEDKAIDYSEDEIISMLGEIYNSVNSSDLPVGVSTRFFVANPEFWLYTRDNTDMKMLKTGDTQDLLQSNFSISRKTWFIIHGWMGNGNSQNVQNLKTALLDKYDVNVVIVNWGTTAFSFYSFARSKIDGMAGMFYDFLNFLVTNGYSLDDVNMVGHSLGAHIAGLASKRFGNDAVANIIGVDPAGPLFYYEDPKNRLAKTDAKYVEIIHGNAGILGILTPLGDTDVYLNGGTFQPECGILIALCPHIRAFVRYVETIANNKDYLGYKCDGYESARFGNCAKNETMKIGGSLPKTWTPGVYWVSTTTDW